MEPFRITRICNIWTLFLGGFFLLLSTRIQVISGQELSFNETYYYQYGDPVMTETIGCADGWTKRGPRCYRFFEEPLTFWNAHKECGSQGGFLVMPESERTNRDVNEYVMGDVSEYWIGLIVEEADSTMAHWADERETDVVVGNWAPLEPAMPPRDNDMVCTKVLNDPDKAFPWSLGNCMKELPFICERQACIEGQFLCTSGTCINEDYICDGDEDCPDGSDEIGDPEKSCPDSDNKCCDVCRQYQIGASGSISSTGLYDPFTNCQWLLQGPVGSRVVLKIKYFDTEKNDDVLNLYAGEMLVAKSESLVSFSGDLDEHLPIYYISSNNMMIVRFTSDGTVQGGGFDAEWTTRYDCTFDLMDSYGYEDNDPLTEFTATNSAECEDTCFNDVNCDAATYVKSTKRCTHHWDIMSPVGDDDLRSWSKSCPGEVGEAEVAAIPMLGGKLQATSDAQYLHSPFFPQHFYGNTEVNWLIMAPPGDVVTLKVEFFDLGTYMLGIFDGDQLPESEEETLAFYTGNSMEQGYMPYYISSHGSDASVYMTGKAMETGRGFDLTYQTGCAYVFEFDKDHAGLNGEYPAAVPCSWTYSGDENVTVVLELMDVPADATLEVFDQTNTVKIWDLATDNDGSGYFMMSPGSSFFVDFEHSPGGGNLNFTVLYSIGCDAPDLSDYVYAVVNGVPGAGLCNTWGETNVVECQEGYAFMDESYLNETAVSATCEYGGEWAQAHIPMCKPMYCGEVPSIENGKISNVTSVSFGGLVTYECSPGFLLSSQEPLECLYTNPGVAWGTRSGDDATCYALPCPAVPELANGWFNYTGSGTPEYGDFVYFYCDDGYHLVGGSPIIYCATGGIWSHPSDPVCEPRECLAPVAKHGNVSVVGRVEFNTNFSIVCDKGYALQGIGPSCMEGVSCWLADLFDSLTCDEVPCDEETPDTEDWCSSCPLFIWENDMCKLDNCSNPLTVTMEVCMEVCDGYTWEGDACVDVNECDLGIDECYDSAVYCANTEGSYTCSCPYGSDLYIEDGFNGLDIPVVETGSKSCEWLHINHTCVPKICEPLPDFPNGKVLQYSADDVYRYEDEAVLLCDLGFTIDGGCDIMANLTCLEGGMWDQQPNCTAVVCEYDPIVTAAAVNPGVPSDTFVDYGSSTSVVCDVEGYGMFETPATCAFDPTTGTYGLMGASWECGEVNCGSPEDRGPIPGLISVVTSTTYGATFDFACDTGFTLEGVSSLDNITVTCMFDPDSTQDYIAGYWDLGDLRCEGPVCTDPGRPPNGRQISTSYEDGSVVIFECDDPSLTPVPYNITCDASGPTWDNLSPNPPECQDQEAPTFTDPLCGQQVTVSPFDSLSQYLNGSRPAVDDNIAVVSVTSNFNAYAAITETTVFTFEAADEAGNLAECVIIANVTDCLDYTFAFDCNNVSGVDYNIYLLDENSTGLIDSMDFVMQLIDLNATLAESASSILTVDPPTYTLDASILDTSILFTITYSDGQSEATCQFQRKVQTSECAEYSLRQPANGVKTCPAPNTCVLSCSPGYVFYGVDMQVQDYMCTDGEWSSPDFGTYVPDCVYEGNANYTLMTDVAYQAIDQADKTAFDAYVNGKLGALSTALTGYCIDSQDPGDAPVVIVSSATTTVDDGVDYTVIFTTEVFEASFENDVASCAQLTEVQLNNRLTAFAGVLGTLSGTSTSVTVLPVPGLTKVEISCAVGYIETLNAQGKPACLPCPAGYYAINSTACELCAAGDYQDQAGQADCMVCPPGSAGRSAGATSTADCEAMCPPGFRSDTGLTPCEVCGQNNYWVNETSCEACPTGYTTSIQGATDVNGCIAPCAPGMFSDTGYEPCKQCPQGYYTDVTTSSDCTPCATGETTPGLASTDASNCTVVAQCIEGCQNGGVCDSIEDFTSVCSCNAQHYGRYCEDAIDRCYGYCFNGGVCADDGTDRTCTCPPGSESPGGRCEVDTTDCQANPISCENGYCKEGPALQQQECMCPTQGVFTGPTCIRSTDVCAGEPCGTNGTCIPMGANDFTFWCSCINGHTGPFCETDIDDCVFNRCFNGGTCVDEPGSFSCECPDKFDGDFCENLITPLCDGDPCGDPGTCFDNYLASSNLCVCDGYHTSDGYWTEWFSNPVTAEGDDETRLADTVCTAGLPEMIECREVDTQAPYSEAANFSVPCTIEGGLVCVNTNETSTNCTDYEVRYYCSVGLETCVDIDECADDPCQNGGVCVNLDPSYQCDCPLGESGEPSYVGQDCQCEVNECDPNPCLNGGECHDYVGDYNCTCADGWEGDICDVNIPDCDPNPCVDADCEDLVNDYLCHCPPGMSGKNCTEDIDECQAVHCLHGANCTNMPAAFECKCVPGWDETFCDHLIDNCEVNPCNGGMCSSVLDGFLCKCPPGFSGDTCLEGTDLCKVANPCLNDGDCDAVDDAIDCTCSIDFFGIGCQYGVDHCRNNGEVCENGAKCIVELPGFSCACPTGFSGEFCDVNDDDCADITCDNGGQCMDEIDNAYCSCQTGTAGPDCSKDTYREFDLIMLADGVPTVQPTMIGAEGTIGMWVQFAEEVKDADKYAPFLILLGRSVDPEEEMFIIFGLNRYGFWTGADEFIVYPGMVDVDDGAWHYVGATWEDNGEINLIVDNVHDVGTVTVTIGMILPTFDQVLVRLGGVEDDPFAGKISFVQMWDRALHPAVEFSALNKVTLPDNVRPPWYLEGLLVDWDWGTFTADNGALRTTPSLRGQKICPPGKTAEPRSDPTDLQECVGEEKLPPSSIGCPSDNVALDLEGKQFDEHIFDPPVFEQNGTSLSRFGNVCELGMPYSWGQTSVLYVAQDMNDNWGRCSFNFFGVDHLCDSNDIIVEGDGQIGCQSVGGYQERCGYTCNNPDQAPAQPGPNYYTCSSTGSFNKLNPSERLRLPVCGPTEVATKNIDFGWVFDNTNGYNEGQDDTFMSELKERFSDWFATTDATTKCDEPASVCEIVVTTGRDPETDGTAVTISIKRVSVLANGMEFEDALEEAVLHDNAFAVPVVFGANMIADLTSYWSEFEIYCPDLYGAVGLQCVECSMGSFYNQVTRSCQFCMKGFYQTGTAQTSCLPCDGGLTTEVPGATKEADCIPMCQPGNRYNWKTSSCEQCGQGFYQELPDLSYCNRCPIETTTAVDNSTSVNSCAEDCDSGYRLLVNGSCEPCPYGWVRDREFNRTCVQCGTTMDGAVERPLTTPEMASIGPGNCTLVVCPGGWYREGEDFGTCIECPPHTYREEDDEPTTCIPCDESHRTDSIGANWESLCRFYCPAGFYINIDDMNDTYCEPCPRHTYKNESLYYAEECTPCPAGTPGTYGINSTSVDECYYANCTAGEERDEMDYSICHNCSLGFYQPEVQPHLERCLACPDQTFTRYVRSEFESDCIAYCPSGQQVNAADMCEVCLKGFHKNNSISVEVMLGQCLECPTNFTTLGEETVDVAECSVAICEPGQEDADGDRVCEECPMGSFKEERSDTLCTLCEDGYTTDITGATSDICMRFCPSGEEVGNNDKCVECERGYHKNNSVSLDVMLGPCLPCPDNSTTDYDGSTGVELCSIAVCDPGWQGVSGEIACTQCDFGFYKEERGVEMCEECKSGETTTSLGSTSKDDCVEYCESGLELDDKGRCQECLKGFHKDNSLGIQVAVGKCMECPMDTTTPGEGTVTEEECSIASCNAGREDPDGNMNCTECLVGYYKEVQSEDDCSKCPNDELTLYEGSISATDCTKLCESGMQLSADGQTCEECPIGAFKNNTLGHVQSLSPCMNCSENTTTEFTGSTGDALCSIAICDGGFEDADGDLSCEQCQVGFYKEERNTAKCEQCPGDQTTAGKGSTSVDDCITQCPPGEYIDGLYCKSCDRNTYNPDENSDACLECPDNKHTTDLGSDSVDYCKGRSDFIRVIFSLELVLDFVEDYLDPNSDQYQELVNWVYGVLVELLRIFFSFNGDINVLGVGKGSTIISIEAYFNPNETEAARLLQELLQQILNADDPTMIEFPDGSVCGSSNCSDLPIIPDYDIKAVIIDTNDTMPCAEGFEVNMDTGDCELCPNGTYQIEAVSALVCSTCPERTDTRGDVRSGATEWDVCKAICGPGQEEVDGDCADCEIGFYKEGTNSAACESCGADRTTAAKASTAQSDCFLECPIGEYNNEDVECLECDYGFYNDELNQDACKNCQDGYSTSKKGATEANDCKDLCELDLDYCQNGGTCSVVDNAKKCECRDDYMGDTCQDIYDPSGIDKTVIIAASVTAGVLFLAVLGVLLYICCRKRQYGSEVGSFISDATPQYQYAVAAAPSVTGYSPAGYFSSPAMKMKPRLSQPFYKY